MGRRSVATIDGLLQEARGRLREAPFEAPGREAMLLLGHVLGLSEAQLLARGDGEVSAGRAEHFRQLLSRRLTGEPVAYLLGVREFYGRPFRVDRRVLIPRPETEHLVEAVLERAAELPENPRLLDVGTGSGCLAVTLALELPTARVVATDLSLAALAVAGGNARALGAGERVRRVLCDLDAGLSRERFDLIVSNPPYVARRDHRLLSREITDFEPPLALFVEGDGTAILTRLAAAVAARLAPGGRLLCEIGDDQLSGLAPRLAAVAPELQLEEARRDYAGKERVVILKRRPGLAARS